MIRASAYGCRPPKRAKRAAPEAQLQMAVVKHLTLRGVPGLLFFRIPNDAKRSVQAGAWEKRMGLRPGVADLCIIVNGDANFLELKAGNEKQTLEQQAFEADAGKACCCYEVAGNIDDALRVLETWGAIRSSASRSDHRDVA